MRKEQQIPIENIVPESDWQKALSESSTMGLLSKDGLPGDNIPDNLTNSFSEFRGSRFQGHIKRLIMPERSREEKELGLTILKHYRDSRKLVEKQLSENEVGRIIELIGGEGNSTTMWWTLAPFIYEKLRQMDGVDDLHALALTIKYALTPDEFDIGDYELGLEGLQYHNQGWKTRVFTLSQNIEGETHRIAKKLASALVEHGYII